MKFPDSGDHIQGDGYVLVITSSDLAKQEVTAKFFQTEEEALAAHHKWSLEQLPEWHKEHCVYCNGKPQRIT